MMEKIHTFVFLISITLFEQGGGQHRCSFEESTGILKCGDLFIAEGSDEALKLNLTTIMPANETHHVDQLIIENSTIPILNLNFIGLNHLSRLSGVSIHECNISIVVGEIPCHVTSLRLSNNAIMNFTAKLLKYRKFELSKENINDSEGSDTPLEYVVSVGKVCRHNFSLDLMNNRLEELPVDIVTSPRLKSVHLSGNLLKCEFIWETVWDHLECSNRTQECRSLFVDPVNSTCQFYRHTYKGYNSGIFHYNLAQIFDSKITLEAECSEMNKTCLCHPFNLLRGEHGTPTVYLSVNCASKNLTELPKISNLTWELNVSSNNIQSLAALNDSDYRNLRRLDVSDNLLDELMSLTYTDFMGRFDLLFINYNKIQKIPDSFLLKVKNSEGKGLVKLGSHLECECYSATSTKGRVIELQNNILDLNDILCGNVMNDTTNEYLKLKNLKLTEFCPIPTPNSASFDWLLPVIVLEIFCILGVITKVFFDWRNYQRTGILPWIAEKLPRLPCDGILE